MPGDEISKRGKIKSTIFLQNLIQISNLSLVVANLIHQSNNANGRRMAVARRRRRRSVGITPRGGSSDVAWNLLWTLPAARTTNFPTRVTVVTCQLKNIARTEWGPRPPTLVDKSGGSEHAGVSLYKGNDLPLSIKLPGFLVSSRQKESLGLNLIPNI